MSSARSRYNKKLRRATCGDLPPHPQAARVEASMAASRVRLRRYIRRRIPLMSGSLTLEAGSLCDLWAMALAIGAPRAFGGHQWTSGGRSFRIGASRDNTNKP